MYAVDLQKKMQMTVLCRYLAATMRFNVFLHVNRRVGTYMNNIKKVAQYIVANPDTSETKALLELAVALETSAPYELNKLYEMSREQFKLALGLIEDWRLDRHYLSKLRLLDHAEINQVPSFQ